MPQNSSTARWKVADLKREFARVHPELPDLLEALQLGYQRYLNFEELGERIAKAKPELFERLGLRGVLEVLFVTSVVGVRPGDSGKIKFRSEDSDLALPPEAALSIHQSLRKGLDITERRERTRSMTEGAAADADDAEEPEVEIH